MNKEKLIYKKTTEKTKKKKTFYWFMDVFVLVSL